MLMNLRFKRMVLIPVALAFSATHAFAHHMMGGRTPATFGEGMLSGLGHPIIGLDHFAGVVAAGCIAAMHSAGAALVVAFIVAMMAGVALHLNGATFAGCGNSGRPFGHCAWGADVEPAADVQCLCAVAIRASRIRARLRAR